VNEHCLLTLNKNCSKVLGITVFKIDAEAIIIVVVAAVNMTMPSFLQY